MTLTLPARADTSAFKIVDDPKLDKIVSEARGEFLKKRKYTRLDATVLILQSDGSWRRGSHNPEAVAYPASCVKLPYMAAAMHWCRENGHPYDYLDRSVRPMITVSDNLQTGVVVDAITGTQNLPDVQSDTPAFREWIEKRRYSERFLDSRGLLGNQVILHKTYPTNSGSEPAGAEKYAREKFGMNLMQPKLGASLMLEVVKGAIEPEATEYMRGLLRHDRWSDHSGLGFGLPPGSINENKLGVAYDTVEDIMYAALPNGKEVIIAAFTNGRDQSQPFPHDTSHLGLFCELLLERAGLTKGLPPIRKIDNDDKAFVKLGEWENGPEDVYQFGKSYMRIKGGLGEARAAWELKVPETGLYELCVWYPEHKDNARDAVYTVYHAGGSTPVKVNQQSAGGRWVRLGDFLIEKGEGRIELTNRISTTAQYVAADAVKASKWPGKPLDSDTATAANAADTKSAKEPSDAADASTAPATGAGAARMTPLPPFAPAGAPKAEKALVEVTGLRLDASDPKSPVARVSVQVRDNLGNPVPGAEIKGKFFGDVSDKVSATTGDTGQVTFESSKLKKKKSADATVFTFAVEWVSHPALLFDPAASPKTHDTLTDTK